MVSPTDWAVDKTLKSFFGSDVIFSAFFGLTSEGRIISRTVYSMLAWMSDIGGLYGVFVIFFAFVVGSYNDKVYQIEAVISNFKVRANPISQQLKNLQDTHVLGEHEVAQLLTETTQNPLRYSLCKMICSLKGKFKS